MLDFIPYGNDIAAHAPLAYDWLSANLFTWSTMIQFDVLVLIWVLSHVLSRRSASWLSSFELRSPKSIIRLHVSYREIFFLIYIVIFMWFAVAVAQGAKLPNGLLQTLASLGSAWAVIRFTSSTIESAFWSRLIAISLWVLAALNIVGWLDTVITTLDNAAIIMGQTRLSVLLVVKSLLAFALLLWAVGLLSSVITRSLLKASGITPSQKVLFGKLANIMLYALAFLVGLNIVGLDLTALTVFSGALGLGIGFGLQKVFSNLISGIILLLDKSVKPGDVIAIGDTYGWVNSLGARCVSVLTRDGKEHLIPNENLITQEVENWSYSNKMVRLHIPVGVSFNADMQLVKQLMLQAVEDVPRILKQPKPVCFMVGYGDSSVDHELRVWIRDPEQGVTNIKSAVYYRIWELFKEHQVQIPFPQRDVHVKLEEGSPLHDLLVALLQEKKASS